MPHDQVEEEEGGGAGEPAEDQGTGVEADRGGVTHHERKETEFGTLEKGSLLRFSFIFTRFTLPTYRACHNEWQCPTVLHFIQFLL